MLAAGDITVNRGNSSFLTPMLSERIRGSLLGFPSLPRTRHFSTSLRHVSCTQGPVRFSFPKSVTSTQIRHFDTSLQQDTSLQHVTSTQVYQSNTKSSLRHITSTRHFNASQSLQHKFVNSTQIRQRNTNPSTQHKSVTSTHHFHTFRIPYVTNLC